MTHSSLMDNWHWKQLTRRGYMKTVGFYQLYNIRKIVINLWIWNYYSLLSKSVRFLYCCRGNLVFFVQLYTGKRKIFLPENCTSPNDYVKLMSFGVWHYWLNECLQFGAVRKIHRYSQRFWHRGFCFSLSANNLFISL